jgi:acetoin utilization deacetylase AcuC-like enzyme
VCLVVTGNCANVLDVPLPMRLTAKYYMRQFEKHVVPFIRNFKPDLIIFSAGFDARHGDAVAGMGSAIEYPLPLQHPGIASCLCMSFPLDM